MLNINLKNLKKNRKKISILREFEKEKLLD